MPCIRLTDNGCIKSPRPSRRGGLLRSLRGASARGVLRRCLQGVRRLWRWPRGLRRPQKLRLSSERCAGSVPFEGECEEDGVWRGFCPCCKRPVEVAPAADGPAAGQERLTAGAGCAYVVVLWGSGPAYCLGAMVLGRSLQASGTRHDLVLLHTDEVTPAAQALLARAGWKVRQVEPIAGVRELYGHGEPRFKGVFTKLRAMALVEYRKVLLLDIDTLVLRNMDDLFDLPAPAAMARGPGSGYRHGDRIDGRAFFRGATQDNVGSWGQAWGINAGVMLWEPNLAVLEQMLVEVLDPRHPSHIKGNGPEQDYLSRYWANSWSHIGCEYNFQLHQMYFALHPDYLREECFWDRTRFLFQRPVCDGIALIHYSGALKPWSRFLDEDWSKQQGRAGDSAFAEAVLESFPGYWLWVRRDPAMWREREPLQGLVRGPDGKLRRRQGWGGDRDAAMQWTDADLGDREDAAEVPAAPAVEWHTDRWGNQRKLGEEVEVPAAAVEGAQAIVEHSLAMWRDTYAKLQAEVGVPSLAEAVQRAFAPPEGEGAGGGAGAAAAAAGKPVGWKCCRGWWVDKPVARRASCLAGSAPEAFVVLTLGEEVLLELRGAAADGAHALALRPDGGVEAPDAELEAWVARLPAETLVLIALVNLPQDAAQRALAALSGSLPGAPSGAPPPACHVAVAAGVKGQADTFQTMAGAQFALVTLTGSGLPFSGQLCRAGGAEACAPV